MNIYGILFSSKKTLVPLDENFNWRKFEESPQIDNVNDMIGESKEHTTLFYFNADYSSTIKITLEGITNSGIPVSTKATYIS